MLEKLKQIKQYVIDGHTDEAIKQLLLCLKENPRYSEVIQQSGRLNKLKENVRKGTISFEEGSVEENKIREAIVELVSTIEDSNMIWLPTGKKEILLKSELIFDISYSILQENQRILIPVFQSDFDKKITENKMAELFGQQTQRAYFRRCITSLQNELEKNETSPELKRLIENLIIEVHIFMSKLYNKTLDKNKYIVCQLLKDENPNMKEVKSTVEEYLDFLRNQVDTIGEIVERINQKSE